ncbi:MAG: dihydrodipicolinate synthase family protein [Caldisericaceae bacterium]
MITGVFRGVNVALITPFNEDYSIDYNAMAEIIEYVISKDADGIFVNATTGEFTSLSLEEKKQVAKFVSKKVDHRVKLFLNVSSQVPDEVKSLCDSANELEYDAVVSPPPYFLIPDEQGIINYFTSIAQSSNLPTFIYNIPVAAGYSIKEDTIKRLAMMDERIAGVKATIDSSSYHRNLIEGVKKIRPEFTVFTGIENLFVYNLLEGGDGAILGFANAAPHLFRQAYNAYIANEFTPLAEIQRKVGKLSQIYDLTNSFAGALKISLNLMGFSVQPVMRKPFQLDDSRIDDIKNILREVELI